MWAISWGGLYLALDNGLIAGQDGIALLTQIPYLDNFIDLSPESPILKHREYSNIGVSFVLNEALELGRFPVAVATTPIVTKMLGIKPNQT